MNAFAFSTSAGPGQVWAALTDSTLTARYLHGLTATSTWRPGSAVTFQLAGAPVLTGEVLASEAPHRLSYTVAAGEHQPSTYVTWEIWADGSGSVVRLYVDDPDRPFSAGTDPETVAAWSEVVTGLVSVLAAPLRRVSTSESLSRGPRSTWPWGDER